MPIANVSRFSGEINFIELAKQVEARRVDLIELFLQTMRENVFTNRAQILPRKLAEHASKEADALIALLRDPTKYSLKEHGAYLCMQGFSTRSVIGLYQAGRVFFQSVLKINVDERSLIADILYEMLEGYFGEREKRIQREQEGFRLAFQLALNRSNAEIQEARSAAQKATESNYRNVILAQEEERRRISRELHDQAGQLLIGVSMSLENILNDASGNRQFMRGNIQKAVELADNAAREIKTLAYSLRPPVLDLLGINLTIKQLCLDFSEKTKLPINYSGMEIPSIADELAITIYRVVQEALTNIVKHAGANHAWIKLDVHQGWIRLSVKDNGQGFDPVERSSGMGLAGMQERVRLLNGEMTITSSKGKYTKVGILLPLILRPASEGMQV